MFKSLLILVPLSFAVVAQQAEPGLEGNEVAGTLNPISEPVGANHRMVVHVSEWQTPDGRAKRQTNSFTQLELGLNRRDSEGRWVPATPRWTSEGGWAVGREAQHGASVYYNINAEGAVVLDPPGGPRMRSHLLGLVYHDTSTGESVLIGEVQDSQGIYLNENEVLFESAFVGVRADVRYTYARSGFSQDIILREQPPGPEQYNLHPETTRLEVWTEFLEGPDPVRTLSVLNQEAVDGRAEAPLLDEELDFGSMRIGLGRAFPLGNESDHLGFVAKSWNVTPEGRRFLVETVDVPALVANMDLPPHSGGASVPGKRGSRTQILAGISPKKATSTAGTFRVESPEGLAVLGRKRGVVVDYTILNPGYTNITFKGNETYYVSGVVTCSGTTTFEGGCVYPSGEVR